MKTPTKNAKTRSKKKTKTVNEKLKKFVTDKSKNVEPEGLDGKEQPLYYYGLPPIIRLAERKSGFDPKFHPDDLVQRLREGQSRSEIVATWGISYATFNDWLEAYPELSHAYEVGKPAFDAYYKKALRDTAFGVAKGVREYSLFFMLKTAVGLDDGAPDNDHGAVGGGTDVEFID